MMDADELYRHRIVVTREVAMAILIERAMRLGDWTLDAEPWLRRAVMGGAARKHPEVSREATWAVLREPSVHRLPRTTRAQAIRFRVRRQIRRLLTNYGDADELGAQDLDGLEIDKRAAMRLRKVRPQMPPSAEEVRGWWIGQGKLTDGPTWQRFQRDEEDPDALVSRWGPPDFEGSVLLEVRARAVAKNEQERVYLRLLAEGHQKAEAQRLSELPPGEARAFEDRIRRAIGRR